MSYEVLKKEYVIQTIAKGDTVVVCDFDTMRIMNCADMTVKSINSFIAQNNTVFYKGIVNEQA